MIHRSLTLPRDIILLLIETALQFLARFIYIYISCVPLFRSLGIDRVWRTFDEWNERSWSNYETCFVYNRSSGRRYEARKIVFYYSFLLFGTFLIWCFDDAFISVYVKCLCNCIFFFYNYSSSGCPSGVFINANKNSTCLFVQCIFKRCRERCYISKCEKTTKSRNAFVFETFISTVSKHLPHC